jgi:hypothetical protein
MRDKDNIYFMPLMYLFGKISKGIYYDLPLFYCTSLRHIAVFIGNIS